MIKRTVTTKVAGVTYEGRQAHIARMKMDTPIRIVPEPTNPYDPNALAVYAAIAPGEILQVGYVPRDLALILAPLLDGESVMARVKDITGGFELQYGDEEGDTANLGLKIEVEYPVDDPLEDPYGISRSNWR
jgi:hypothetical protein